MKTCKHCGQTKPLEDFHVQSHKIAPGQKQYRRSECKLCTRVLRKAHDAKYYERYRLEHNARVRARRLVAQRYVDAIKSTTPCADCGRIYPAVCMDFDHLPGMGKDATIGHLVGRGRVLRVIQREIARCQLVCSNCHRIRTEQRRERKYPRD